MSHLARYPVTRVATILSFAITLLLSAPLFSQDLLTFSGVRIPVEYRLSDTFDGIGSLEINLTIPAFGIPDGNSGEIVYIYFIRQGSKVSPFVHVLKILGLRRIASTTLVFTGKSDYGFPFSCRVSDFDDVTKRRLSLTIQGAQVLLIEDLLSEEAMAFKTEFIPKVDLGTGPYLWKK
jgi:hypothetical protein